MSTYYSAALYGKALTKILIFFFRANFRILQAKKYKCIYISIIVFFLNMVEKIKYFTCILVSIKLLKKETAILRAIVPALI